MRSDSRIGPRGVLSRRDDQALAHLTTLGCANAWEAMVQRHRAALARYCEHLLPYGGLAEDIVQDSLVEAYEALRDGEHPRHPRAWLFGIARHHALTVLRSGHRTVTLETVLDGLVAPDDAVERRQDMAEAVLYVRSLPEHQRQALVGRVLEDRPYAEIAASLRVSEQGARQLVARARRTVRTRRAA